MSVSESLPPSAPRVRLERHLERMALRLGDLPPDIRGRLEQWARRADARLGVGRYLVLGELGRGGMGVVLEAWDPGIERRVAIKTLEPDLVPEEERDEVVERFRRETRIIGRLEHPAIVTVYDSGVERSPLPGGGRTELHYYVMEFLEGRSLARVLREDGAISAEQTAGICASIAEALALTHEAGVIHRDIKPSNVFLRSRGGAVLLDFGIAKSGSVALTRQGQILGTPSYLAPERLREKEAPIDGRADLFSLGVLAYTMVSGGTPFPGADVYAIIDRIAKGAAPSLPFGSAAEKALAAVVDRLLAKRPSDRFADAGSAAAALRQAFEAFAHGSEDSGSQVASSWSESSASAGEYDAVVPSAHDITEDDAMPTAVARVPGASEPALLPFGGEDEATVADMQAPRPRIEVSLVDEADVVVAPVPDPSSAPVAPLPPAPVPKADDERVSREELEAAAVETEEIVRRKRRARPISSVAPRLSVKMSGAPLSKRSARARRHRIVDRIGLALGVISLAAALGLALRRSAESPEELVTPEVLPPQVSPAESAGSPTGSGLLSAAQAAHSAGNEEEALALFTRASEALEGELAETARLGRADVLRDLGRKQEAIDGYRALAGSAKGEGIRRNAKAELAKLSPPKPPARRRAKPERAETAGPEPSAPPPKPSRPALRPGRSPEASCRELLFRHAGDPKAALEGFVALAEAHPEAPCAVWNLGVKHEQVGQPARAAAAYRRYLELDPDSPRRAAVERRIESLDGRGRR